MYIFILANILRSEQNISSDLIQPSRFLIVSDDLTPNICGALGQ